MKMGYSLFATALAISLMEAGSFSGGEFCHLSKGFKSSQPGFPPAGMSIAGVEGLRLGDNNGLRALSVTFRLRRALASQFAICDGFSSVLSSSSAFSSSVGYGLSP